MPSPRGGDLSQNTRAALGPTRAVLRRCNVTALATLRTRKGTAESFRDLVAGSHQFNALSRSSLLLAAHPDDGTRRLVLAGKQNYSTAAPTESFELAAHRFPLNGHEFSVSQARDFRVEPDIDMDTLMSGRRSTVRDELRDEIFDVLTDKPMWQAAVARAVDRKPKDGTVGRALAGLAEDGQAAGSDSDGPGRPPSSSSKASPGREGRSHELLRRPPGRGDRP
jgi:hypothetical protein